MGPIFMAGFNGANKIDMFAFFPAQSFGMALTTFVGQNIGAGKMHRVKEGLRATMLMSVLCGIGAMVLVLTCGPNMMHLFSQEAAVVEAGMDYLRPVMYCYLLFAIMNTVLSVLRGAGDMVFPMITSLLSLWIIRLPMAYLFSYWFGKEYIFFQLWRRLADWYDHGNYLLFYWPLEEKKRWFRNSRKKDCRKNMNNLLKIRLRA